MHESSLDYIFCVRCKGSLELDALSGNHEITEGFLYCKNCSLLFPIISGIAILWDDFASYLSHRKILGGRLYVTAKNPRLKSLIKKSLSGDSLADFGKIEERWCIIYQQNSRSSFYSKVKSHLDVKSDLALEHGCSIGILSEKMAGTSKKVFGIDKSFAAIQIAKKRTLSNADFFVADSLSHPFGDVMFDLIVALNLLEIIEPKKLVRTISDQMQSGHVVLSDPYDFDRGQDSVRVTLDEKTLRAELKKYRFSILPGTRRPSFVPWNLRLNSRTELRYAVDLVVAKRSKGSGKRQP